MIDMKDTRPTEAMFEAFAKGDDRALDEAVKAATGRLFITGRPIVVHLELRPGEREHGGVEFQRFMFYDDDYDRDLSEGTEILIRDEGDYLIPALIDWTDGRYFRVSLSS